MKKIAALAAICLLPVCAQAGDDGWGISGKVGTLGAGLDINTRLSDSVTGRVGFNKYNYNATSTQSTVTYNANFQLQTVEALADWYPFRGGFRTTFGLMYNSNKLNLNGTPTNGTFTINGTVYQTNQVGSLIGDVTFNKAAPYLGIGWGNPVARGKGWGFVADLGVLFQGSPKVTLNAACGAGVPAATCATLQSDAQAEAAKAQSSLSNYKYYPVAAVGVSYQF